MIKVTQSWCFFSILHIKSVGSAVQKRKKKEKEDIIRVEKGSDAPTRSPSRRNPYCVDTLTTLHILFFERRITSLHKVLRHYRIVASPPFASCSFPTLMIFYKAKKCSHPHLPEGTLHHIHVHSGVRLDSAHHPSRYRKDNTAGLVSVLVPT